MVGNKIIDELFSYAEQIMHSYKIYPFVDFIVKNEVIISRGYNNEREDGDITMQSGVVAIRKAQEALDSGNLSGYTLVGFCEPTILTFDLALWTGIKDFVWCVNSTSLRRHYNKLKYTPLDYLKQHAGEISITGGVRENDALKLAETAFKNKFYPENLL